jgi:hypothetical protein
MMESIMNNLLYNFVNIDKFEIWKNSILFFMFDIIKIRNNLSKWF